MSQLARSQCLSVIYKKVLQSAEIRYSKAIASQPKNSYWFKSHVNVFADHSNKQCIYFHRKIIPKEKPTLALSGELREYFKRELPSIDNSRGQISATTTTVVECFPQYLAYVAQSPILYMIKHKIAIYSTEINCN